MKIFVQRNRRLEYQEWWSSMQLENLHHSIFFFKHNNIESPEDHLQSDSRIKTIQVYHHYTSHEGNQSDWKNSYAFKIWKLSSSVLLIREKMAFTIPRWLLVPSWSLWTLPWIATGVFCKQMSCLSSQSVTLCRAISSERGSLFLKFLPSGLCS